MTAHDQTSRRTVLYIDMAYSLAELRQRGHYQFFEARHSGGYFDRVIGLHPLADRVFELDRPVIRHAFTERQDIIEGSASSLGLPSILFPIDFIVSQYRLFRLVRKIVRDERVDLIAATDPLYSGLFGYWLKSATGRPLAIHLVAHFKNLYASTGKLAMPKLIPTYWLEQRVIRFVMRRGDLIAAGTQSLAEYAEEMGAEPGRICVLTVSKNVMPEHRLPPEERGSPDDFFAKHGINKAAPIFLTVARHDAIKLVDHTIRAMRMIVDKYPHAQLLLAGKGGEQAMLKALTRELGLEKNIFFLGLVDQQDLACIVPFSISLSPLTGMALFETSLGGAPAIAYDIDSQVAELVVTDRTGYLVPFQDFVAMGEAGIRILSSDIDLPAMRERMRRHAMDLTDIDRAFATEHDAFDQVLSRTDRSPLRGSK